MTRGLASLCFALLTFVSLLLVAVDAKAQMTLLQDSRRTFAHAEYQGVFDSTEDSAATPGMHFESLAHVVVETYEPCEDPPPELCYVGACTSQAYQNSQFFPAAIQFGGETGAHWGIPPSGTWSFLSSAYFRFRIDTTFDYQLFADVDPGDWPSLGEIGGDVSLASGGNLTLHYLDAGSSIWTGRLGPGEYILQGRSSGAGSLPDMAGAAYGAQWLVFPVMNPFIISQPPDQNVPCGTTVTFSIGTSGPPANYTYQWRRNLSPLMNNGHVSGVTTGTLVINNVCDADSGDYDVVVTGIVNGSPINEPSRLAHLGITANTAVQDPVADLPVLALANPSPNPFRLATSVRYDTPDPVRLRANVYSVSGAKVRTLMDQIVSGTGTFTWDGTSEAGVPSPRGIYFLHVELGGTRQTSKLVRIE